MPADDGATQLLERTAELAACDDALARARRGEGGVLLVAGAAGIGKTKVLRALREEADAQGLKVLRARGAELEEEFSFGVARQLFEPAVDAATGAERSELLSGPAALVAPMIGEPPAADAPRPGSSSFAAPHGLHWLTVNLADRGPLVLIVDDAHWADAPSLRFLLYLSNRIDGLPVLLAVAARPSGSDQNAELVAELVAAPATTVIRPAPLSESATGGMLARRLAGPAAPAFVRACHVASGGNPFLLGELLTALADDAITPSEASVGVVERLRPGAIARAVVARLGRAGADAQALATAVEVLGRDVQLADAAALAGLDASRATRAAGRLAVAEILTVRRALDFVHPLVRTAVRGQIAEVDLADAHARAARLLHDRGSDPEQVAAHLLIAAPAGDAWVVARLQEAADLALTRGAGDVVASYLRRALAEPCHDDTRGAVLYGLGRALSGQGQHEQAADSLREALDLSAGAVARAEVTRSLFAELVVTPDGARQAVELLDTAIAALPEDERELGARLESDIATVAFVSLKALHAAQRRRPRFVDPDSLGLRASVAMARALREGPAREAARLARAALAGGRLLRQETADSTMFWLAALALLYAHDLRGADAVMSEAHAEAAGRASRRGVALAVCFRARTRLLLGDVRAAEADARRFVELMPRGFGLGPAFLIDALVEQGRLDEAEELATENVETPGGLDSSMHHFLVRSRGALHIARGRPDVGLADLEAVGDGLRRAGTRTPGPLQWRPLTAEALAGLGRRDRALELLEEELRACEAFGAPGPKGVALRAAGIVEGSERGLELLRRAADVLAGSAARLEHARALCELGAALRRAGRRADASERLQQAMATARACGATALAERAFAELQAAGARPRKILRSGIDALTPSELRVAQMAAHGNSNRDIAQQLFLTVRTVESHLTAAYAKLGIKARSGLAGTLKDGGAAPPR